MSLGVKLAGTRLDTILRSHHKTKKVKRIWLKTAGKVDEIPLYHRWNCSLTSCIVLVVPNHFFTWLSSYPTLRRTPIYWILNMHLTNSVVLYQKYISWIAFFTKVENSKIKEIAADYVHCCSTKLKWIFNNHNVPMCLWTPKTSHRAPGVRSNPGYEPQH